MQEAVSRTPEAPLLLLAAPCFEKPSAKLILRLSEVFQVIQGKTKGRARRPRDPRTARGPPT